ncbi:unnamed protein product [Camellia sinensis]
MNRSLKVYIHRKVGSMLVSDRVRPQCPEIILKAMYFMPFLRDLVGYLWLLHRRHSLRQMLFQVGTKEFSSKVREGDYDTKVNETVNVVISFYGDNDEKLYYKLTFHRRHREIVTGTYLNHVMEEGKAIGVKSWQRKIFTNNRGEQWVRSRRTMWSHVVFEHPATFDTLAMEPKKKQEIINDLITFTKSKDYYKKIGKAWKREYLLFGPPGTGKAWSSLAAVVKAEKSLIMEEGMCRKISRIG